MNRRTPLLLMEQLLMVLIFALAAAVCVQAFVLANRISRKGAARDQAALCAESAAEIWKSGSEAGAGKTESGNGIRYDYYDDDWSRTDSSHATYTLKLQQISNTDPYLDSATVTVLEDATGDQLCTLQVCRQAEAGGNA
jgi:hypothetical protein